MFMSMLAAFALAVPATARAATVAPPTGYAMFRRSRYQEVEVSPDGSRLAIAYHIKRGTHVAILDRATLKPIKQIDNGKRGVINALAWLGNEQLLIVANHTIGRFGAPVDNPGLYLLNLHDKHPQLLPDNFIGTIDGDDHHILVDAYLGYSERETVRMLDVSDVTGEGKLLAETPRVKDPDSISFDFQIDHAGHVRFTTGYDDSGHQRLYQRQAKGKWKLLNDSARSGIGMYVWGFSRDNRKAYMDVEQKTGTDVLEQYDLATGKCMPLLRDPESDPLSLIWSLDQKQPIGAWFGPGKPRARYFNPSSPDAKWHRALDKSFPGEMAYVTSASENGNVLVIRTISDRDPGSFYLLDRSTRKLALLFHTRPWIDPKQMASTRAFTMKARDGLTLHGFVTMPTDGMKPAPMVVVVHGGPYGIRDTWSYDPETQWLATHGYAVLHINFRGSGGDGRDFMIRGYRQWGRAMQDDVTDATRWAVRQGLAIPSSIAIYGGSYGGYAALMGVVRQPHLYRCAIGLAGVYDLNRLYSWGDIHRDNYGKNYLKRVLGHDKAQLTARSPADQAAKIRVPVFLAHGTMDGRVPVKYAREMRSALESAGRKVEYKTYTYEGHGLARLDHREDFYTRMLKFLHANMQSVHAASAAR